MKKISIIILSALLICFIVFLSCGIHFTSDTPTEELVAEKYAAAGYKHQHWNLGKNYQMHNFNKDGKSVIIVWYATEELAQDGLKILAGASGETKFVVKRGLAVAFGNEKDIKIFQFA